MFCHNNKAFLFCLPKRCSRSRLKKGGSGSRLQPTTKNWLWLNPKSGSSRRLQLNPKSGGSRWLRLNPKSGGSGSAKLVSIQ